MTFGEALRRARVGERRRRVLGGARHPVQPARGRRAVRRLLPRVVRRARRRRRGVGRRGPGRRGGRARRARRRRTPPTTARTPTTPPRSRSSRCGSAGPRRCAPATSPPTPPPSTTRPAGSSPTSASPGARRRSRRLTPGGRARRRPDVRRTMRAALRTEGEPLDAGVAGAVGAGAAARDPLRRERLDGAVRARCSSGSSTARWWRGRRWRRSRSARGSPASPVSSSNRDPDAAIAAAAARVVDWSGGTRIGAALHDVQRHVGHAGHGAWRGRGGHLRRLGPR